MLPSGRSPAENTAQPGRNQKQTNFLPLMTLIKLIDADKPKPLQHGRTEAAEEIPASRNTVQGRKSHRSWRPLSPHFATEKLIFMSFRGPTVLKDT
jgi:hypothetical protein